MNGGFIDRRKRQKWHFNTAVSIPDIITLVAALIAIFSAYATLDKQQALSSADINALKLVNESQDAERRTLKFEINERLNRIEALLLELAKRRRHDEVSQR